MSIPENLPIYSSVDKVLCFTYSQLGIGRVKTLITTMLAVKSKKIARPESVGR